MSDNIIQLNQNLIHDELKNLVRNSVEENLNAMLDEEAALEKAKAVEEKLRSLKLHKAAEKVKSGITETLTYMNFPSEHWTRIRTDNLLERINREIKRRTKVVGTFTDGESALMLVCARLRHVSSNDWRSKRHLNMEHLKSRELSDEFDDQYGDVI